MVRFKNRYLLVEVHVEEGSKGGVRMGGLNTADRVVSQAIREAYRDSYGDYGFGSAMQSLQMKQYNRRTGVSVCPLLTAGRDA